MEAVFKTNEEGKVIIDHVEATKDLNPNSVEITLGAKGDVSFKVKSYGETTEEAREEATKIFDSLREKYNV